MGETQLIIPNTYARCASKEPFVYFAHQAPRISDLKALSWWVERGRCFIPRTTDVAMQFEQYKQSLAAEGHSRTIEDEVLKIAGDHMLYFLKNPYPYYVLQEDGITPAHHFLLYLPQLNGHEMCSNAPELEAAHNFMEHKIRDAGIRTEELYFFQNNLGTRTVHGIPHWHIFSPHDFLPDPQVPYNLL